MSRALRKQSNISPDTQKRIQEIADQLGYRPNPLVSALMSAPMLCETDPVACQPGLYHKLSDARWVESFQALPKGSTMGVAESADRHGYSVEAFWMREPGMTADQGRRDAASCR